MFTKKTYKEIFNNLKNDSDFTEYFAEQYNKANPAETIPTETKRAGMRALYLRILEDSIRSYLYNCDFLDRAYLDISWLRVYQFGKVKYVDLDTIWDMFKTETEETFNQQKKKDLI